MITIKKFSSIAIYETDESVSKFLACLSKEQMKKVLYYPDDVTDITKLTESEDYLLVIPPLTDIKENDFWLLEKFCENNSMLILTYNFRRFKSKNAAFSERFEPFLSQIHEFEKTTTFGLMKKS